MNKSKLIEDTWEKLFHKICAEDDDLYDLVVEYKTRGGETYRKSWKDRDTRLSEENI